MAKNTLPLIGYASGVAGNDPRCGDAPAELKKYGLTERLKKNGLGAEWFDLLYPKSASSTLLMVADLCQRLARHTKDLARQDEKFVVLGGDHSCGIGTWSGVFAAKKKEGPIGLIWIDAHLDSHTPDTTESGNIHGMPVASLLGYGAKELTQILNDEPKILPEHLSLIGVRSFEKGEADLIQKLGVRVYDMKEVQERGMKIILQEAIARASSNTIGFGLSIDLDSVDPADAPGVSTPESNGIRATELCEALKLLHQHRNLLGVEIAEYNPHHDIRHQTAELIQRLISVLF